MPTTEHKPKAALRLSVAPSTSISDVFIVRVDGTVDTLTADELDSVIGALVRQNRIRLVIDLAGADYVSSAGWGVFISRLREIREGGGDLKLARMTPPVRDVYDLLELDGVLRHFEKLEVAEAQYNGAPPEPILRTTRSEPEPLRVQVRETTTSTPSSLEDAIRRVVIEDPFYTQAELRARLAELGGFRVGSWVLLRMLWKMRLVTSNQRFRYYHRRSNSRPGAL